MASRFRISLLAMGFGVGVVFAASAAHAWQAAPPQPAPVLIQPSSAQERFRQSVQQSQVRDQLQKNQVETQLRQTSLDLSRHRPGMASSNDAQVDKAKQAESQLYQSRQRDALQRYTDAVMPQPVPAPPATTARGDDSGG